MDQLKFWINNILKAALNKNGILFITGTDDNYFYAMDTINGEIIWEFTNAPGTAPLIIFQIDKNMFQYYQLKVNIHRCWSRFYNLYLCYRVIVKFFIIF